MLPSSFEYVAPTSVDEAVQALAAGGGDAKVMAGGQSLLPMMKLRLASPSLIVDINNIAGLDTLEESDGMLRIGALVRHGELERSELIQDRYPIILDAAQHIADPLIRNRGTFCGSVAHGDPAGDWATVATALGAELHAVGPNGAVVHSATDFQTSMFETKLGADQILVEARIPMPKPGQGSAYKKIERKVGDYAAAAVGVSIVLDGTTITEAAIGLTNVGPLTINAADAAASLIGKSIDDAEAIEQAGVLAAAASDPASDLRGPADYKRDLVRVLTKRALRTAGARAQGKEA
ncbi:MAG: xanthine dehydrogenase family protein subunit M [Thermoleophilia bacterium]